MLWLFVNKSKYPSFMIMALWNHPICMIQEMTISLLVEKHSCFFLEILFCLGSTMVSYVTHKNKNVLSNFHHESSIDAVPKDKPQIILDYKKYICYVDVLHVVLKGYHPYWAIRRWSCVVFFELLAMVSQASYVLYCIKYPDKPICRDKKRRDYLYHLAKELIIPEMKNRKESICYN